jgi:hypothetical protein
MRTEVNIFQKGLISDIDEMLIPNGQWTFPTQHARIISKDGHGFIITEMKGNTEIFSLTDGFVPLGACEFNGILYIASHNPITLEGELGSFPSPRIGAPPSGFERKYKPLKNYVPGIVPEDFKTKLFNWDLDVVVDIIPKKSYDDTVELYLCDNKNPNRVINSNFTQQANRLRRLYTPAHFNSYINLYPTHNNVISADLVKIISPGDIKCGTYIFYFRLMTENFDTTNIVAETGPCQVYSGGSFGHEIVGMDSGTVSNVEGGNKDRESGKTVYLRLYNPDTTYKYVQVSYTKYFSDDNDVLSHESRQINFTFPIILDVVNGIVQNYMTIPIIGNESSAVINDAMLLRKYPIADRCKTHTSSSNRYFGANWKTKKKHDELYVEFCKRICINYNIEQKPALGMEFINDSHPDQNQYKDYRFTYNGAGYFRTETYPFVAILELMDGTMTDSYPVTGIDALMLSPSNIDQMYSQYIWNLDNPGLANPIPYTPHHPAFGDINLINSKGLFRFPDYNQKTERYVFDHTGDLVPVTTQTVQWVTFDPGRPNEWTGPFANILHPVFNFDYAIQLLDRPEFQFIKDSVRAIHIARSHRNKNLKYQGLMMVCSKPVGTDKEVELSEGYFYDDWKAFPTNSLDPNYNGGVYAGIPSNRTFESWGNISGILRDPYNRLNWNSDNDDWYWNYKNAMIPLYKGYCPAHWYIKKSTAASDKKSWNINHLIKMYFQSGQYAFYSFDFLFNKYNNIENINVSRRVLTWDMINGNHNFKAFKEYRDSADKGNSGIGLKSKPSIFPTVYEIDTFIDSHQFNPQYKYHHSYYYNLGTNSFKGNNHTINNVVYWDDVRDDITGQFEKIGETAVSTITSSVSAQTIFINDAKEYWQNPADCMWYIEDTAQLDRNQLATCRSMYAQKYIAYNFKKQDYNNPLDRYGDANHDIFNFYETDPYSIYDITTLYQPEELFYHLISKPYSLQELIDDKDYKKNIYRGDCYLQRAYFKQMYWNGSQFGSSELHEGYDTVGFDSNVEDNPKKYNHDRRLSCWSHGLIIGLILESENNIAMRHSGETSQYYPKTKDPRIFAISPLNVNGIESLLLNKGYNQQLSERSFPHYFKKAPVIIEEYETRIYHSGEHIPSSFIDGFRTVLEGNYEDYDKTFGPIHKIIESQGLIISIQRDQINKHFANEEQVKVPTSETELIIGTGPILSKQVKPLANYGTQHSTSIIKGYYTYGVDWQRRVIWRIKDNDKKLTSELMAEDLTTGKLVSKWFNDFAKSIDNYTDIKQSILDIPRNGEGIISGYDPKNKQLYFSFYKKFIDGDRYHVLSDTIVYNETLIDSFETTLRYTPAIYMTLDNEFITMPYDYEEYHSGKQAWLEDSGVSLRFYGIQHEFILSFIMQGTEGVQLVSKQFFSQEYHSEDQPYSKVLWETEYQAGGLIPFIDNNRFYALPVYSEHKWQVPIFVKTNPTESQYQPDSDMRGTFLKTSLYYDGNMPIFIKEILTNYEISKS